MSFTIPAFDHDCYSHDATIIATGKDIFIVDASITNDKITGKGWLSINGKRVAAIERIKVGVSDRVTFSVAYEKDVKPAQVNQKVWLHLIKSDQSAKSIHKLAELLK